MLADWHAHALKGLFDGIGARQGAPAAQRSEAVLPESAAAALEGNAMELGLQTVGSLDLGGSSLEVTYMPSHLASEDRATSARLRPLSAPAACLNPSAVIALCSMEQATLMHLGRSSLAGLVNFAKCPIGDPPHRVPHSAVPDCPRFTET
jgi:hypothetical protein